MKKLVDVAEDARRITAWLEANSKSYQTDGRTAGMITHFMNMANSGDKITEARVRSALMGTAHKELIAGTVNVHTDRRGHTAYRWVTAELLDKVRESAAIHAAGDALARLLHERFPDRTDWWYRPAMGSFELPVDIVAALLANAR